MYSPLLLDNAGDYAVQVFAGLFLVRSLRPLVQFDGFK